MFLQNISTHECSLSGQPSIRVFNRAGTELNRSESPYRWNPSLPRPRSPIVLTSSSNSTSAVSAVVEFNWCGFTSSYKRIDIDFGGWKHPFEVFTSSEASGFYSSPTCKGTSRNRLSVDQVRELGSKGISGLPQLVRVTPSAGLHNGEKVKVVVRGFWPQGKFWISECVDAADVKGPPGCGVQLAAEPFGMANDMGTGTQTFTVHSNVSTPPYADHKTVQCAKCVLMATSDDGIYGSTPIKFSKSQH